MKTIILTGTIVLLALSLTGCTPSYRAGKESFDSSSAALQRRTEIYAGMLAQITTSNNPIGGTALIVLPSDHEIRKNFVRAGQRSSQESVDYATMSWRYNFQFMADAIDRRRLFDSVTIARHNGSPRMFPIGNNDYLIFLDIEGWFIKSKNKSSLPIHMDNDKKLSDIQRTEAFLVDLHKQAQTLQGN